MTLLAPTGALVFILASLSYLSDYSDSKVLCFLKASDHHIIIFNMIISYHHIIKHNVVASQGPVDAIFYF